MVDYDWSDHLSINLLAKGQLALKSVCPLTNWCLFIIYFSTHVETVLLIVSITAFNVND